MQVARWLHVLPVVVWVGGMFFAHFALRPSLQSLPPPVRLPFVAATLGRFLLWVAPAIVLIVGSGFALIAERGGWAAAGPHVHVMTVLGVIMMLLYAHIVAAPYRRLRAAVAAGNWEPAGAAVGSIRRLVAANLLLGIVTISVAMLWR